jgi:DNA (cytosine-5)-methyltransferase 1
MQPTHLDLFSGIGGFALAAQWAGFRTIAFCEIDKYCQKVLAKNFLADALCERRQQIPGSAHGDEETDEGWPAQFDHELASDGQGGCARIHADIFDFDGTVYRGCDLITGGFPCQPFSCAGKRRGKADDRALWPEMFRVINEARPTWVLGENVPGIISMELDNVLSDLEGIGYSTRTFVIPACAVDARHRRDRLWIVAHAECCGGSWRPATSAHSTGTRILCEIERPSSVSSESNGEPTGRLAIAWSECCEWQPEPDVGRVAHGIPSRVDRLKGLGNAIVPQVAYQILREIRKLI